jgi:inorganic pyrophosphatase
MDTDDFWQVLDTLFATNQLVIDRPRGSAHPRYPESRYSLDYGYLSGTYSGDSEGIDVWVGTLPEKKINGVVCTVDLLKRDSEIKLLLGCSREEMQIICSSHQVGTQSALLIERP